MSSYVLCIFEGVKTEINITNNLIQHYLNDDGKDILRASFGFPIYKLYESIVADEFFDTYELIVEELSKRTSLKSYEQEILEIDSEKISDIYLFFDYDCHCSNASNDKLEEMLNVFDDPQDKGLLCISYPMVEAIKHQKSTSFMQELHPIDNQSLSSYKRWLNSNSELSTNYKNWGLYTLETWNDLTRQHLARANLLVNGSLDLPTEVFLQKDIFDKQLEVHYPNNEIAVISSFPLMLYNYYGKNIFNYI
ncbi:hypothetical protein [Photobacterium angustum]|uniref:Uncharacterized protein n=1 Tax=Photobacterium angustum TaxID=661 RepID=A0A855SGG2_PHOAN|nr:hypothetical protein [Photobacterium angustum]KJF83158.1 hypothetical protein UB36_00755 [Photobacterium damselae subsp. damselae]KJG42999.1 hypothetical protein UA35_03285 [Photobacterium angustum]KJG47466.1 hypothetical protein UA31_00755 [Photobacterium angustum]KJG49291.1 hypothetical protein UA30_08890 [Photobacterium angustum]KJG53625.1 hypothetical protein UA34_04725 [Photobacterium angustum]